MTGYGVKIVGDEDLPENINWMFVKMTTGELLLILTRSASGCSRILAEVWAAYRQLETPSPMLPGQRRASRVALA